jgi:hypothetical protein
MTRVRDVEFGYPRHDQYQEWEGDDKGRPRLGVGNQFTDGSRRSRRSADEQDPTGAPVVVLPGKADDYAVRDYNGGAAVFRVKDNYAELLDEAKTADRQPGNRNRHVAALGRQNAINAAYWKRQA